MPVIQSRALDRTVGNIEPEGLYEVQVRSRSGTGTRDIAAILWDLRLDEHDIQHDSTSSTRKFYHCTAKILRIQPKMQSFETKF